MISLSTKQIYGVAIGVVVIAVIGGIVLGLSPETSKSGIKVVEGAIIKGFPEVPEYSNAEVVRSHHKHDAHLVGFEGLWTTTDSTADVYTYFSESLESNGWGMDLVFPDNNPTRSSHISVRIFDEDYIGLLEIEDSEEQEGITEIVIEFPLQ